MELLAGYVYPDHAAVCCSLLGLTGLFDVYLRVSASRPPGYKYAFTERWRGVCEKEQEAMRRKKGFTLIELLVVIAIIALLLAILMPALKRVKEAGRRTVCLAHIKQLSLAWRLHANENNGRIPAANIAHSNYGWVDTMDVGDSIKKQTKAIERGRLFPYVETIKVYRCPTVPRDELRSYSIVCSMNTRLDSGFKGQVFTEIGQIPNPSSRAVFICEGKITNYGFAVHNWNNNWRDKAPIHHSEGTTFSFVDGHSEYWKWRDQDTIDYAMGVPGSTKDQPDNQDLIRLRMAVWGSLGNK